MPKLNRLRRLLTIMFRIAAQLSARQLKRRNFTQLAALMPKLQTGTRMRRRIAPNFRQRV